MSRFVQLHVLTNYPPSNLNRDDTGRPKTALVGDATRLRISSQSQKRAWRTSDIFTTALAGHVGTRTKRMGREVFDALKKAGSAEKAAREWARSIAGQFGKIKSDKKTENDEDLEIEQLAHFGTEEQAAIESLVQACAARNSAPTDEELKLLRKPQQAADIAMFGRMLADNPLFNVEAAVQVSHAITVHKSVVEDDYFSAVDDLNKTDKGAAHIGERGYGAGLFYLYVCINRELLQANLGGDAELTAKSLEAFLHALTKIAPTGMQNSHASRSYASYVLAERGDQQPRSLAQAFLKPVKPFENEDMLEKSVKELERRYVNFDKVYGACADDRYKFNVETGEGSLAELVAFVQE
ncbi:putative CRISPR-associated protein, Cse4 family [Candidatus Accumulibacter aalborgensis]|uniref:Putative CRISPR-associated protein, Cse4 family n=1 Tax=Candidatus Accumulibacter aalborgensis TaxID=1860102 RepID=A0A1A8XVM4_9PROT|nr:type I-E CRISPR-associated protein Cas7/Cse4/CasC [Candidatus Accumulibacter aalborgensis]SBT08647.1 putative CRISPR-associated protein, Cse4 family [Candidatus Accumulibacter aalborgensis]